MIWRIAAIASVGLLTSISTASADLHRVPFSGGVGKVDGRLKSGARLEVVVRTRGYWESLPYKPGLFWGTEFKKPKTVIASVDLSIDGRPVPVPLPFSAFADLAEPKDLALSTHDNAIDVTIRGGHTATAYDAVLNLKYEPKGGGYLLQKRRVSLGEFPDEVWEETTYSWNISEK